MCCSPPLCFLASQTCRKSLSGQSWWPSPWSAPNPALCSTKWNNKQLWTTYCTIVCVCPSTVYTVLCVENVGVSVCACMRYFILTISQSRAYTPAFPSGDEDLLKVFTKPSKDSLRPSCTCCYRRDWKSIQLHFPFWRQYITATKYKKAEFKQKFKI